MLSQENRIESLLQRKEIVEAIKSVEEIVSQTRIPILAAAMLYYHIKMLGYTQTNITKYLKLSITKKPETFTLEALDLIIRSTFLKCMNSTVQEKLLCSQIVTQTEQLLSDSKMDFVAQVYCWIAGLRSNLQQPTFSIGNEVTFLQFLLYVCWLHREKPGEVHREGLWLHRRERQVPAERLQRQPAEPGAGGPEPAPQGTALAGAPEQPGNPLREVPRDRAVHR